ncbi:MAG: putative DNA repair protein MutK [Flavobacterium sp.]|jgi:predicted DNA repair protein MutK
MASGIFALLDDIAALMDDVVVMSKIATKKTAGILGDDLAVNAEKASGFVSSREIPVLWAITKGSFLNKLIILPFAFLLSYFVPWLIAIILILGAVYLAYEAAEKIYEYVVPHPIDVSVMDGIDLSPEEILEQEKAKIKSAIVTDFILSVEIVIIALGTVLDKPITTQIPVVSFVAILATLGVYGIVAAIVRMDDLGIVLTQRKSAFSKHFGTLLIRTLPLIIKGLAFVGTIALILVSGGIFVHNIEPVHHALEGLPAIVGEFIAGVVGGILAFIVVKGFVLLWKKIKG